MDTKNENLETVATIETELPVAAEEELPVVPVEELAVEEPVAEEPAVEDSPAEPARKARKFPKLPKIRITKKGAIIGGIAAAVVIIAVVLIVLLTGNGKTYELTKDGTTMTVTVLEDGFKVEELRAQAPYTRYYTDEEGTYTKNSDGTYTLEGYWTYEDVRLVNYTGDYYLSVDEDGAADTDTMYLLRDGEFAAYSLSQDISYSKNSDGTYRLGEEYNVKLKSAGDGLYSVVSVDGDKNHDFGSALIKLDSKLGIYRVFYRTAVTCKVIEGETKNILRLTSDDDEVMELWFEGEFVTCFEVSASCDYIQKQRGDDRIVYLMGKSGDVEDIITITGGKTVLDGITLKSLGDGKYYAIYGGEEYRLHLSSNGTYKLYEEVTDGELRGRAELIWEPEEKLEVRVNGKTIMSFVVDGKTLTVGGEGADYELTKVK